MQLQRLGDKLPEQESDYNEPQIPKELCNQFELVSSIDSLLNDLSQRLLPVSKSEPTNTCQENVKDPPKGGMLGDLKSTTKKLTDIRDRLQNQIRLLDI